MNKESKFKVFIKYSLAFFMAFFIFCSVIFAMIGLCSTPDYAKILIKKSDYVELSIEEIEDGLVSIAIPGGLPEDFFDYGITDKTFYDNMENYIEKVYKNEKFTADESAFREEISKKIYAYTEEKLSVVSDDIKAQLDTLVDICCEKYMRYATPKVFQYVGNYFGRLSIPAFCVCLFCICLAAVSYLFIGRYEKSKRVYRVSFLSSALLIGAVPAFLLLFAGINKIGITSKPLYSFITLFIKTPLFIMLILAIVIILAVGLEVIISKKKSLR